MIDSQKRDIVQLPSAPPEANRSDITVAGTLSDRGPLELGIEVRATDQSAAELRRIYAANQRANFQKQLEGWLSASAKQVNLSQWDVNDAFQSERLFLKMAIQSSNYAQLMQECMLIFRPGIVERWNGIRIQTDTAALFPLVSQSMKCRRLPTYRRHSVNSHMPTKSKTGSCSLPNSLIFPPLQFPLSATAR